MAVFLNTPARFGVVVRAEHLFVRTSFRRAPLAQVWRRGADGRLVGRWLAAERSAEASAEQPLPLAVAS